MKPITITDVTVATVVPFTESGGIDRDGYRNVLEYCTPPGVAAVFVNGHAGEGAALTDRERLEILELTRRHVGAENPVMCGVISFSTDDAIRQARDFVSAGCDIPVLFPPPSFAAGGALTPDAPVAFVRAVAEAVDAPLSIFQYPVQSGCGYTTDTLVAMSQIPNVMAIKEGSDTIFAYEETWRKVKAARPDVAVLPSNFDWFLPQLAIGADGILSGLASLTPHLLVELWRAAEAVDLRAMRAVSDRLYPIVRGIYGRAPRMDMHTRIKEGLQHLGIIKCAKPRGPLLPVSDEIRQSVRSAVDGAGLRAYAR
ncbi:MAG: dihydrodipicolinate synthase family protein [Parvibaculaceae bacterium]